MSVDATSLVYKEALSLIEDAMPGTRIKFYSGFLQKHGEAKAGAGPGDAPGLFARANAADSPAGTCAACGAPSYTETCSYCRLKEKVRKAAERR